MNKEQALTMLSNAEGHLWALVPPKHFLEQHPVEEAAILQLQSLQRQLGREIRKSLGWPAEALEY